MDIAYKLGRVRRWSRWIGLPAAVAFEVQRTLGRSMITLTHPGLGREIALRGTGSDISVFEHVFIAGDLRIETLMRPPRVIVDGGANCGLTTLYLATRFPQATVLAIEPGEENCALIARNTQGLGNVQILRGALWSRPTRLRIENPADEPWAYRCVETGTDDTEGFDGADLATILRRQGLSRCDLLKLDIEGAERELFRAPNQRLEEVDTIIAELHGADTESLVRRRCPQPDWQISRQGEKLVLQRMPDTTRAAS